MNDKYLQNEDTALCGSDILNGYMSSRIIRSKFLTDKNAFLREIYRIKLPTTNTIDTDENSLKNGTEIETVYPVPPPLKRI